MATLQLIIFYMGIVLWTILFIQIFYLAVLAVAGRLIPAEKFTKASKLRRMVVLIPAYKEDGVIVEVATDALHQDYPRDKYDVVVIADSLKPETVKKLQSIPVKVVEVKFEKSTKSKALNAAMSALPETYDCAVILDADNLMESNLLHKINDAFEAGYQIVQGHRVARNLDTPVAILDAVSEEINNHIFREGNRAVGLSCSLIGSGMAFNYKMFKEVMQNIQAVGGFDKELELYFTREGIKTAWLPLGYVYDEKVQNYESLGNQRRRWLAAQFIYFGQHFGPALLTLVTRGNLDYFFRTWQQIQLPRVLLLGLTTLLTAFFLLVQPFILSQYWLFLWALLIFTLGISMPVYLLNTKLFHAVLYLPAGIWKMFLSLLKIKGANKTFIHTTHTGGDQSKGKKR